MFRVGLWPALALSAPSELLSASHGRLSGFAPALQVLQKQVKILDEMMANARDYSVQIHVTRGLPQHVVKNLGKGDTFTDHGYSSTSFAKVKAGSFGDGAQLDVRLPKGFKFLSVPSYARAMGQSSGLAQQEAEAILPRGTTYKIRKIVKSSSGKKIYYVDALSSAIQPPKEKWVSSKTAKKLQQQPPLGENNGGIT